jgi:nitroimidazol reductase NimA-like FMN-containing flavoprotein (pyridoxamine 5'-phosphate oxidase superfamily)
MLGRLTRSQIDAVLRASTVGRIGVHADGKTYVVPVTYVYDGDSVYGHSVLGQKILMMRKAPDVCFEVDDIGDMANWMSVIAYGRYEELAGDLAIAAAKLIAARLGPLTTSETAGPAGHGRGKGPNISYRIRLSERSGRYERPAPAGAATRRAPAKRARRSRRG